MMLLIGVTMYDQAIDTEIARVNKRSRNLLSEYVGWNQKIKSGEIENTLYGDLIDFVNFRLETVETCLMLIENERIADALGLCRSILENYMLLILMCRGYKLFRLRDPESKTDSEFNQCLLTQQQELEERKQAGNTK